MAIQKVLEKQAQNLETTKQDKNTQVAALFRPKEGVDKESLETFKDTKRILQKSLNVDIGISKDIKIIAETSKGDKVLKELDALEELKKSVDKLAKTIEKQNILKKDKNIESDNRPLAGVKTDKDPDKVAPTVVKEGSAISQRRQQWRDKNVSGLRQFLTGAGSKGQGGFLDDMLTKRENRAADKALAKRERSEFIRGALENDKGTIGVKNLAGGVNTKSELLKPASWNWVRRAKGEYAARKYAGEKFDALKAKENEAVAAQDAMDRSEKFGYAPKVKNVKERDKAMKELAAMPDPRKESQEKQAERAAKKTKTVEPVVEKEQVKENAPSSTKFQSSSEEKEEAVKFEADTVGQETKQVEHLDGIGKTLIASLETHKQMLEAIKSGAGAGGGGGGDSGGSMLDTALDAAGSLGKRGGGLLTKAGSFLGKAGPGLLKGGIGALGGMALSAGGDALIEGGHEKVGGAVSTLGTAASYAGTGAMIGSVIPGVGTAIGAGVGGAIGLGKGLYDNWSNMFGGKKTAEGAGGGKTSTTMSSEQEYNMAWNDGKPTINGKSVSVDDYVKISNAPTDQQPAMIKKILAGNSGATGSAEPAKSDVGPKSEAPAAQSAPEPAANRGLDPEKKATDPLYQKIFKEELARSPNDRRMAAHFADKRYQQEKSLQPAAAPEGSNTANAVQQGTDNLNNTKDTASKTGGNNIVSAPTTNINNTSTQNNTTRMPVRHEDGTLNKYIGSRYATY